MWDVDSVEVCGAMSILAVPSELALLKNFTAQTKTYKQCEFQTKELYGCWFGKVV
jgi:hypothetical protein